MSAGSVALGSAAARTDESSGAVDRADTTSVGVGAGAPLAAAGALVDSADTVMERVGSLT